VALAEFLTAMFDADYMAAKLAGGDPWRVIEDDVMAVGNNDYVAVGPWRGSVGDRAPHIARNDPARVLREVEAKRRIVALHATPCEECISGEYVTVDNVDVPEQYQGDCRTLRLMALPYADRPGYRQEWRP
jgi:hypothetical protein